MLPFLAQAALDAEFWREAVKQAPAPAILAVGGIVIVALFLRYMRSQAMAARADSRRVEAVVDKFFSYMHERDARDDARSDRHAAITGRATEAIAKADEMTDLVVYEVRELRRTNDAQHALLRHATNNLANVAGLKAALGEKGAVDYKAAGGPPGTMQAVVSPEPPPDPLASLSPEPA